MLIGYARVSTQDQDPELQIRALTEVGCEKIFSEKASGAQRDRPELGALLDYIRKGDTLVVWKMDRLTRSLKQLLETVEGLEERGIGFKSVTESIDTTKPGGRLVFTIFGALAESNDQSSASALSRVFRRRAPVGGLADDRAPSERATSMPRSPSSRTQRSASKRLPSGSAARRRRSTATCLRQRPRHGRYTTQLPPDRGAALPAQDQRRRCASVIRARPSGVFGPVDRPPCRVPTRRSRSGREGSPA
jgi:DNA invertase Pin-like site-specific DNA recombinase